jgi:hypothetical protein
MADQMLRIWVDLENSPHVLFFEPIIRRLREQGHEITVTARDFCNTLALARSRGVECIPIGRGYDKGRKMALKWAYNLGRVGQLWAFAIGKRFDVAASHCSRTQALAAWLHRIPIFSSTDYEYNDLKVFRFATRFIVPDAISAEAFEKAGVRPGAIRFYHGLKEEVYLRGFRPKTDVRAALEIPPEGLVAVVRPIADQAHYGNPEGDALQAELFRRILAQEGVWLVVLPRTRTQWERYREQAREHPNLILPEDVVDGPSLLATADLALSGGGTMVREAVALGVPAVSYFEGAIGQLDQALVDQGRLTLARRMEEIDRVLPILRCSTPRETGAPGSGGPLEEVVACLCAAARREEGV